MPRKQRTTFIGWWTKDGKKRRIRLYGAWRNMQYRVTGVIVGPDGVAYWLGLDIHEPWLDFLTFRAWALANGYSARNNSLDRINPDDGYLPHNCRWIPKTENCRYAAQNTNAKKARKRVTI